MKKTRKFILFIKNFIVAKDILFFLLENQYTMFLMLKDLCISQRISRVEMHSRWIDENLVEIDKLKSRLRGTGNDE